MENKANVTIRFYQPGDEQIIVNLLTKTFPKWGKFSDPLNFWSWKYLDTPQRSLIFVAMIDDKIVGCNHSIIYNAKVGSEVTKLSWNDDLAVDADYRGLGIWGKIRAYKENLEKTAGAFSKYDYQTTTSQIVKKSWENRNRGLFPFKVTRMVKVRDIDLHLRMRPMENKSIVKYGYSTLKTLTGITNVFSNPIKHADDFTLIVVDKFDDRIDFFWEKIKDDYAFILEKKCGYLNWRFTDNEKGKHTRIQAMKNNEVLGYTVLGFKEEESYFEGQIEELIALGGRSDVAESLLDYASKFFDDQGINSVYYQIVEGHPYQRLSRRRGFVNSRSNPNIAFHTSLKDNHEAEINPLVNISPRKVYFNYAETV